jgi:hypothetical protein
MKNPRFVGCSSSAQFVVPRFSLVYRDFSRCAFSVKLTSTTVCFPHEQHPASSLALASRCPRGTRYSYREEPGKPRKDARRGRCHPLEAGFWPLWMTPLPRTNITEY